MPKKTEDNIRAHLQKAREKLEKVEDDVAMWEDLLAIVEKPQRKLDVQQ